MRPGVEARSVMRRARRIARGRPWSPTSDGEEELVGDSSIKAALTYETKESRFRETVQGAHRETRKAKGCTHSGARDIASLHGSTRAVCSEPHSVRRPQGFRNEVQGIRLLLPPWRNSCRKHRSVLRLGDSRVQRCSRDSCRRPGDKESLAVSDMPLCIIEVQSAGRNLEYSSVSELRHLPKETMWCGGNVRELKIGPLQQEILLRRVSCFYTNFSFANHP